MSFRIFKRVSWRKNPTWPNGLEPNAVPVDSCHTVTTVATRADAVRYCCERNDQRPRKSPARELAGMYEFTEL